MTDWVSRVTLQGKYIRLEPLSEAHIPGLAQIGIGQDFWQFMLYGDMNTEDDMRNWVLDILEREKKGGDLPFAVIHLESGRVAGATRYLNILPKDRGLEIGGTWYGPEFQRTAVNTECKYLLLGHAFETLKAIRVQIKTDSRNERSQRAIERLGAKREGVLRNHMILPDGYIRHSVFYSIIDSEWGDVKKNLEAMLAKYEK
ncbi:MAG TPA: GNAT family protein [Anaerolineales bacterium]|jgi:RimJ/RimL family protein N-acetyltransferase|nr:GNAT family N-acetyltransferase [Anaerolineae bacterium]HRJ57063.1 GNAT family protein [Anaerolineales bacterium]HRK87985.1 GNAT family protein [Anaerolineales bacterium]